MIATALSIGISKKELFEDYYIDEVPVIVKEWNKIHGGKDENFEDEKISDPRKFFGDGGDIIV